MVYNTSGHFRDIQVLVTTIFIRLANKIIIWNSQYSHSRNVLTVIIHNLVSFLEAVILLFYLPWYCNEGNGEASGCFYFRPSIFNPFTEGHIRNLNIFKDN